MAGIAKPSKDILIGNGKEGKIQFLESDYVYDTVESLLDGDLTSATGYGVLMTYGIKIGFKTSQTINLYAYGKQYYDSAGSTQHSVTLYKLNDKTQEYDKVGEPATPETEAWKLLFKEIVPGTYKIVCDATYVSMTEWFIETSATYLIRDSKGYYNVDNINYDYLTKSYKSLAVQSLQESFDNDSISSLNELFEQKNINEEVFKPIDKFGQFTICRRK